MIINHNLPAINANRQFKVNTFNMDVSMESIASGMRINRGRDDAAGLAVSEKMRSQIRGLHQASRNAQDGIAFIQTTEGWLEETGSVLQRMRELAVQASNGIYTNEDRMQIQVEILQLVDEIDRIASHAEFNTMKMLGGAFSTPVAGAFKLPEGRGTQPTANADNLYYPDQGGIVIHVGANMDQRVSAFIMNMNAGALGLVDPYAGDAIQGRSLAVTMSTMEGANQSIAAIDEALYLVNRQRADLGAYQNRLEHAIRGIDIAAENLQSAESNIRDTDMAMQMVEYVKNQILSQASSSMLAHANNRPQMVLRLLG